MGLQSKEMDVFSPCLLSYNISMPFMYILISEALEESSIMWVSKYVLFILKVSFYGPGCVRLMPERLIYYSSRYFYLIRCQCRSR